MDPQAPIASWFADNLRRVRKEAGISQEELSIAASVHRTEVSQLERGLRIIRIDTLMKIAGALEVSPCDLLTGLEWTPGSMRVGSFRAKREKRSKTKPRSPEATDASHEPEAQRPRLQQQASKEAIQIPSSHPERYEPNSTTHYEPSRFVPEPHLLDQQFKKARRTPVPSFRRAPHPRLWRGFAAHLAGGVAGLGAAEGHGVSGSDWRGTGANGPLVGQ